MADLARLERMVLRRIGRDFFVLPRGLDRDDRDDPVVEVEDAEGGGVLDIGAATSGGD